MKWYELGYVNEYGVERAHTFSGEVKDLQRVLQHWNIALEHVTSFTVNDKPVDIERYVGGDDDEIT